MANDQQMKDLARRLYDAFSRGDYSAIESIISPNIIEHENIAPGVPQTRDGLVQWLKGMHQAFPDLQFHAEDVSVDGDQVWVRGTSSGTHRGEFMGFPATGKKFLIEFFDEMRVDRNVMVEHWGQADVASAMQQIGMTQMMGSQGR